MLEVYLWGAGIAGLLALAFSKGELVGALRFALLWPVSVPLTLLVGVLAARARNEKRSS